jgi:hypothetical protein
VQVQVAHVAAELARRGHADQGVHVGAVHVHAAAVAVHQLAQLLHLGLEHAVRAGVGDHHAGQVGGVLLALGLQVGHVHVAVVVALGDHHLHAHHLRAGRVGAVGAAGIRQMLRWPRPRGVPGLDGQQAGVFALAAGVGLQADARVAGGWPASAQLVVSSVAAALVGGAKGCTLANSGQVMGIISLVALSFMVQLPSGIMLRSSARSLSDSCGCSAAWRFRCGGC